MCVRAWHAGFSHANSPGPTHIFASLSPQWRHRVLSNFGSRLKQINFNWLFLRLSIFSFPLSSLPEIFSQGHVLVLIKTVLLQFFFFPTIAFHCSRSSQEETELHIGEVWRGESHLWVILLFCLLGKRATSLHDQVRGRRPLYCTAGCQLFRTVFLLHATCTAALSYPLRLFWFEGILGGVGVSARCLGVNQEHSQ